MDGGMFGKQNVWRTKDKKIIDRKGIVKEPIDHGIATAGWTSTSRVDFR